MQNRLLLFIATVSQLLPHSSEAQVVDGSAQWTWMKGETSLTHRGSSAGVGVENSANNPCSTFGATGWVDTAGNLWLFGGDFNNNNTLNAMWRYNIATNNWMQVHGTFSTTNTQFNVATTPGTRGTPAGANQPGSRRGMASWTDSAGKFWLFGGWRGPSGSTNYFADLWKFDPATSQWTWVSGPTTTKYAGVYGTKGQPDPNNSPRARGGSYNSGSAASWVDKQGNFWIFGGVGYNKANATLGNLNDLWRYNPYTGVWTWMGGSDESNQPGKYGTKGQAAPGNEPGARQSPMYWTDEDGNFWLFGGTGRDAVGAADGKLNDLWKYDPVANLWTWVHGTDKIDQYGKYGTMGVPDPNNMPGGRTATGNGNNWVDVNGKFWMYGAGNGYNATVVGYLEDLWCYDPATNQWTWMKGSSTNASLQGSYGTKGTPGPNNQPGARGMYPRWRDNNGNFWLLGGIAAGNSRNDLWRLAPLPVVIPAQPGSFTTAKPVVCQGESGVTYTVPAVNGAVSYSWEFDGTNATFAAATTTTPTNTINFAANATSGKLRVRAVNTAGNSPWRDTAIIVNVTPTVTTTNAGAKAICDGDSLLLTATSNINVNYQWKLGTTNVGTNQNSFYAKTAGNYTVTVTSTTSNCSATSSPSTNLTVNPRPVVTTTNTGSQAICSGDSLVLTATGTTGVTYQWKNGTTNVGTNSATYAAKTSGTYTVTVTTSNNCSATSNPATNLTVRNTPTVISTHVGPQDICENDSLVLTASGTNGVTYIWRDGNTVVGSGATYSAKVSGNYTVTATDANNCSATSAPATALSVNVLPTVNINANGPVDICQGDAVTLSATVRPGVNYQWRNGSASVGANAPNYDADQSGSYLVVATDANTGCADSSQSISVTVHNKPSVTLVPGDTAVCAGVVVKLEVLSQDTGLTYLWKNGGTTIPLANALFLEISETGTYYVEVGRNAVVGCDTFTNDVSVTVFPSLAVNVTWDGVTLHATPGYNSYQWYNNGQAIVGATDSTYVPESNSGYSVVVMDENDCNGNSPVYNLTDVGMSVSDVISITQAIRIYPNPANGVLYIQSPIPVHLYLRSIEGRLVQYKEYATELDLSGIHDGIYLLQVADVNGVTIKNERIIKRS